MADQDPAAAHHRLLAQALSDLGLGVGLEVAGGGVEGLEDGSAVDGGQEGCDANVKESADVSE